MAKADVDPGSGPDDGHEDDLRDDAPMPTFHAWPDAVWEPGAMATSDATGSLASGARGPVARMAILLAILLPVLVSILTLVWALRQGTDPRVEAAFPGGDSSIERLADGAYSLWARNDDGLAVRWNACEPIHWVFNPNGAPLGAVEELEIAFERISEISGLQFVHDGETTELPRRDRRPWQPDRYDRERWAPVLISWRTPETTDAPLGATDRAVAIPVAVGRPGDRAFVTAQVIFNRDLAGTPGFDNRRMSIGITMLHELLHVIGLQHVDETGEIMFPFPVYGDADFGPGDVAGMRELGTEQPCIATPEPSDIVVDYG